MKRAREEDSGGGVESETAASLFSRTSRPLTTKLPLLDELIEGYGGMQKGRVCEIFGPAFVGKTAMLMHIAINGMLPKSLGGNGMTVTWVDCDGRLSPGRLQEMARARVKVFKPHQNRGACSTRLYPAYFYCWVRLLGLRSQPRPS